MAALKSLWKITFLKILQSFQMVIFPIQWARIFFVYSSETQKRIVLERHLCLAERYNINFLSDNLLACKTIGSFITLDVNTLSCESLIPQSIKSYPLLPNLTNFSGYFVILPNDGVFLCCIFENTIWNLISEVSKTFFGEFSDKPRVILYHSCGDVIVNNGIECDIVIYNILTGKKYNYCISPGCRQSYYDESWPPELIYALVELHDGRIAAGGKNIYIWEIPLDYEEEPDADIFEGHTDIVLSLAVLPDGRLASGSKDTTIRIWNLQTKESEVFNGHEDAVNCLAVLPDGRLASGGADNKIRIWDFDKKEAQLLGSHDDRVETLTMLPDGRLASGSPDGTVRLWDLNTCKATIVNIESKNLRSMAILPDGSLGIGLAENYIWLADVTTKKYCLIDDSLIDFYTLIALDDETLVSYKNNNLHMYKVTTNKTSILESDLSETNIIAMRKISSDSLAVGHEDGSIVLCNVTTKMRKILGQCNGQIDNLQVIEEHYLVALSDNSTIQVFDLIQNAGSIFSYQCENSISYLKAISPHCIVAACSDKTLRIFDIFKGEVAVGFLEIVAEKLVYNTKWKILWPVPMPLNFPGFDLSGYLD